MCKGSKHCGWGPALEPYWHTVLGCLSRMELEGLWINHFSWTNDAYGVASAVALWDKYREGSWAVAVTPYPDGGCGIRIYDPAHYNYRSLEHSVIAWHINEKREHTVMLDQRLDVILQDKGAT